MRFMATTIVVVVVSWNQLASMRAQTGTGSITGRVTDATRAAISGANLEITDEESLLKRSLISGADGEFNIAAMAAGRYQINVIAAGFKKLSREAIVETGTITTAILCMEVGESTQNITVTSAVPLIQYDSFEISGVTTRTAIDGLPLNGRDFLELAKLEPGAQQATRGSNNRVFVPLLATPAGGNNGRGTRVTVDGGSIMQIGNGGTAMGYSQEVVQEFQVSTVNFDLSTGMTASGSVNVATRGGGREWHGSGFYFFRDHYLSAYPALKRDYLNPDPFFQRQQYGASAGGSLQKNRLFLFANYERDDQRGVVSTELLEPEFVQFDRITLSPSLVDQLSVRLDWHVNPNHSLFVRQSHEGGFSFAPTTINGFGVLAYPSAWTQQPEWTDQSILGWTVHLGSRWVNDLRFSYFFVSSSEQAPGQANCPGCLGIGAPAIDVGDLYVGTSTTTTVLGRRYHLNDVAFLQKESHVFRFGGDWETTRGGRTDFGDQPVTMSLFSPETVKTYNNFLPPAQRIPLPAFYSTLQDILKLPLENFSVGIGDLQVPQKNFGKTRVAPLFHLFFEDQWLLSPSLTLSFGVAWNFDAPLNYDLSKPAYLSPVLSVRDLSPTHHNWSNFSPSAGFAWSLGRSGKTVIRGGVGVYYDFQLAFGISDNERVSLGPKGVGRESYSGAGIANPLTDVNGVPPGVLLNFSKPTNFSGTSLFEALPTIRTTLMEQRGDPSNTDYSIRNIESDKQGYVDAASLPNASSLHFSIGLQREIARDFVINADFVLRNFNHVGVGSGVLDVNHYLAARGPQLPICATGEQNDPESLCSLGPIYLADGIGSGRYIGLLVRAEKRYSNGWQFLGSYAYSSGVGNIFTTGFDNDAPLSNYGPLNTDLRNILSISGLAPLPWKIKAAVYMTYVSRPPFSVVLGGIDLNGDGNTNDLLPGTTVNQFNRGLGKRDLLQLVTAFNQTYAGQNDANGTPIPLIKLPNQYEFGDPLLTQDLRLSRIFPVKERLQMNVIGEVFNVFNIANLSGRSNNILSSGFGQPKSRVTQVFGSGGPRAFQFAVRVSF